MKCPMTSILLAFEGIILTTSGAGVIDGKATCESMIRDATTDVARDTKGANLSSSLSDLDLEVSKRTF